MAFLFISEASHSQEHTFEQILNALINANKAGDSEAVATLADHLKQRSISIENPTIQPAPIFIGINRYYAEIRQRFPRCDYFIADGPSGYFVFEWYGGHDPFVGEIIMGDINSFGIKSVVYPEINRDGRIYVEDFYLSYSSAMRKIGDRCDLE